MTDLPDSNEPAAAARKTWPLPPVRLPRVALGDTQRVLLLSIVIGLFAGLLVVCFHISIDFVRWATVGLPFGWHPVRRLLWPAIGAVIAATLVRYVFVRARGSGVIHAKAAIHISDGIVPPSTVPGKFAACAVAIGCGNSLGPEDPALQMGVGVASIVGRVFRLPREHMRLIAPIGAAAGIAAAFNTPITGVLFVIEEVIGSWNAGVLGSILLSAVSAVVVSRWYLGDAPLFRVPALGPVSPADFLIYAAIGVIGGLAAAFYVRLMLWLKKRMDRWTSDTARITLPGLAGLFVGIVGLWLPQVQGPGYLTIDSALHDRFDWSSLLLLGFAKILVTSWCFAAGTPGGLFAPTLFAGAMIGGGIGALAGHYWPFPFPHATQSAFVLVGMGTFFAGVFRAPMTSIFMVFEVSASYQIILPVMIANTLGYLIARQSGRVHFFDELAREEGVELPSVQEAREARGIRVEDAMSSAGTVLRSDATVGDARSAFAAATTTCLIVRCAPRLFATVHRAELDALTDTEGDVFLADAYQLPNAPHLYPDLPLDAALRKFSSHPALPVVRRDAPDDVIGLLTLEDVAKAFRIERRAKSTPDVLSAAR
jgi:CIC family chloride channel protein